MTPWRWWWLAEGDDTDGGWEGDHPTREQAIGDAQRHLPAGTAFEVIEARSSEDMRYEGADCVPFLRTRSLERLSTPQSPSASTPEGERP